MIHVELYFTVVFNDQQVRSVAGLFTDQGVYWISVNLTLNIVCQSCFEGPGCFSTVVHNRDLLPIMGKICSDLGDCLSIAQVKY